MLWVSLFLFCCLVCVVGQFAFTFLYYYFPSQTGAQRSEEPSEQQLEDVWQEVSSELSALLQGREEVPQDIAPFDAASEVDVDQQR